MSKLAVIATLVALANGGNHQPDGMWSARSAPASALTNSHIAHNSLGPSKISDTTMQSAVDLLKETRKAIRINERRNRMKPGVQDRVAESDKPKSEDKTLILGGKEAFPM